MQIHSCFREYFKYIPLDNSSLVYGRTPESYIRISAFDSYLRYRLELGYVTDLGQAWKYDSGSGETTFSQQRENLCTFYKLHCYRSKWEF